VRRHSLASSARRGFPTGFRPIRTLTDGAGGFLPGVPLGCLGIADQDQIWSPGPQGEEGL
jgi:hypothetical protein